MKTLLLLLSLVSYTTFLNAQSVTWIGTTSTDWGTATNWDTFAVPTASDSVVIAPTLNAPKLDANRAVGNILIQFDAVLDFGSKTFTVKEDFINDGSIITEGSTIAFEGVNTQIIIGNHTFYNVEINNSNGVINHWGEMSITGDLSLMSGTFETRNSAVLISNVD